MCEVCENAALRALAKIRRGEMLDAEECSELARGWDRLAEKIVRSSPEYLSLETDFEILLGDFDDLTAERDELSVQNDALCDKRDELRAELRDVRAELERTRANAENRPVEAPDAT